MACDVSPVAMFLRLIPRLVCHQILFETESSTKENKLKFWEREYSRPSRHTLDWHTLNSHKLNCNLTTYRKHCKGLETFCRLKLFPNFGLHVSS